ncbi:MAG: hypothetical protein EOP86_02695 [Verrucomicrobiaceae bacterium]|nr:MAG: hypothetical protein EOP86_02695 [Verrucomicrobiaceae bacterium]
MTSASASIPRFVVNLKDPVEIRYFKAMLRREYPDIIPEAIDDAVTECARRHDHKPFESREKLLECARSLLKGSCSK